MKKLIMIIAFIIFSASSACALTSAGKMLMVMSGQGAATIAMVLVDSDGHILVDSNNNILTTTGSISIPALFVDGDGKILVDSNDNILIPR